MKELMPTLTLLKAHADETPIGGITVVQNGTLVHLLSLAQQLPDAPEDWMRWIHAKLKGVYPQRQY